MAKKFKGTTHLLFILDKSGSMSFVRSQIVSGFNEFLQDQKDQKPENVKVTLTTFDTNFTAVYENVNLEDTKSLTDKEYRPGGLTALHDAIAYSIKLIDDQVKKKDRVLVVVLTDGAENASKEHTRDTAFNLISKKEAEGNWTFTYIGANQDSWLSGGQIGINAGNIANYDATDPLNAFSTVSVSVSSYMQSTAKQSRSFYDSTSKPQ